MIRVMSIAWVVVVVLACVVRAQESPPATSADAAKPAVAAQPPPVVQPGDRVLFVGDELTQQMMYTRAVAAAYMALLPQGNLWFYNGGKDGATAGEALTWIDELLSLTQPTVVVVCFGLNDGRVGEGELDLAAAPGAASEQAVKAYREKLGALVDRIKAHAGVRAVAVMNAPPYQVGIGAGGQVFGYNVTLSALAKEALRVAEEKQVRGIDLFEHMRIVYDAANQTGGEPLSLAGKLPNETGHVVIASMVLYGLGVRAKELSPLGWSPIVPIRMRKIRNVLALDLEPPGLDAAQKSRNLYVSIAAFDEQFFRYWRLAPRKQTGPNRAEMRPELELTWAAVQEFASRAYGPGGR